MGSTYKLFGGKRKKKHVGGKKEKKKKLCASQMWTLALHAFPAFQYSIDEGQQMLISKIII